MNDGDALQACTLALALLAESEALLSKAGSVILGLASMHATFDVDPLLAYLASSHAAADSTQARMLDTVAANAFVSGNIPAVHKLLTCDTIPASSRTQARCGCCRTVGGECS